MYFFMEFIIYHQNQFYEYLPWMSSYSRQRRHKETNKKNAVEKEENDCSAGDEREPESERMKISKNNSKRNKWKTKTDKEDNDKKPTRRSNERRNRKLKSRRCSKWRLWKHKWRRQIPRRKKKWQIKLSKRWQRQNDKDKANYYQNETETYIRR